MTLWDEKGSNFEDLVDRIKKLRSLLVLERKRIVDSTQETDKTSDVASREENGGMENT